MVSIQYIVFCAFFMTSICLFANAVTTTTNNVLDLNLYEEVIDLKQCERQLNYIVQNNTGLRNRFMDASFRFPPRSILKGNLRDTGNYFQCLDISQKVEDMYIAGKYSVVNIPLWQDNFELPSLPEIVWPDIPWPELPWPEFPWPESNLDTTHFNDGLLSKVNTYERAKHNAKNLVGNNERTILGEESPLANASMELAFCIPKVCTPRHAFDFLTMNLTSTLTVEESFVRLPNDKPWVAADYVGVILFSIVGLLTVLSTGYEIRHTIILKRDPKKINKIHSLFSIYTNTKNFFVFPSGSNVITCLEGIRSIAMIWVIVGHVFLSQMSIVENPLDIFDFMVSFWSLWITSATITVDTFFMLGGLLLVYTTAAKLPRMALLKNIHLFYLNRILRMFPVLAAVILIQASFIQRLADGPNWQEMVKNVDACRVYWWSSLLYIQIYVNPQYMCIPHGWYLAVDMQLYILSPLVLFWVLGNRPRQAWTALAITLIASLIGAAIYNVILDFHSAVVSLAPDTDGDKFFIHYYVNPINRISPFIIGMIVGYILHAYRGKTIRIPWLLAICLWILAFAVMTAIMSATYFNIQPDWDNKLADYFINSCIRPAWAACIGWIVFACRHGYGGPANWVLSLHIFKILGRLSYSMYIVHFSIIFVINGTLLQPIYFAVNYSIHKFVLIFALTVLAAFLLNIVIDAPFSNIVKMVLGGGRKPPSKGIPSKPNVTKESEMQFSAVAVVENGRKDDMGKARL